MRAALFIVQPSEFVTYNQGNIAKVIGNFKRNVLLCLEMLILIIVTRNVNNDEETTRTCRQFIKLPHFVVFHVALRVNCICKAFSGDLLE